MVVGAKVCELTEDLLWFGCGLSSPLSRDTWQGMDKAKRN